MFSALHFICKVLVDIPYLLRGISLFFLKFLFGDICLYVWASHVALVVKNSPANVGALKRCRFHPWVRKIPWRRAWQPTPVFLPRESLGLRNLAYYSPWGHKELDMTEAT